MEKSLFKKIVNACGAVLSVVMILFIKVGITLKSKYETSNALYKGYFEFVNDASKVDTYGFARFCMIFGFVFNF